MNRASISTLSTLSAFAAGAVLIPSSAKADTPTPVDSIVVTATRLPSPLVATPDAHVIDGQEIDARQITFAADALATVPGLSVTSSGQFGLTSVSIRGASTDKTLVLVDGVPVNDASQPQGSFDFSGLDLSDVSRVEVLSGPQASLWGSDAIGGVISFTTREPNGARADLEGGSFGTTRLSGALGRATDRWALGLTASDIASTGISAADSRNGNSEKDGYRDLTLGARGRVTLIDGVSLDGQLRYTKSRTAIDGYPPPNYDILSDTNDVANSTSTLGFIRARIDGPFDVHHEISVSADHLKRGDTGESGDYGYIADRQVYRWTARHGDVADPVSVEGGLERQVERASVSTGDRFGLGDTSAFAVARWRLSAPLSATASVRYDKPDQFHGVATGRVAGVYALGGGFSLSASAGQGFKTPTISERVCDYCYTTPVALHPEHAEGYDAGLGWRSADGRVGARVTGFSLNVRDQIEYVNGRYVNIQRTRSSGAELEADAALVAGFRLKAAYSYIDAVNISAGARSRELRIPLNSGSAGLFWTGRAADASLAIRTEGDQADTALDGYSAVSRPGFTVVNLAGGYALNAHIRFTARIENLGDTRYQQVFGYGEPGRAVYVGVHFRD